MNCTVVSNKGYKINLSLYFNFSLSGVVVVVYYDSTEFELNFPIGCVWALLGSFGYATYLVMLRRKVDSEEKLEIPMFFGWCYLYGIRFVVLL